MLKFRILIFLFTLFNLFFLYSQERSCGTMDYLNQIRENDKKIDLNMKHINNLNEKWQNQASKANNSIITIPVVVHVLYNNSNQNISDAQIYSQIDILNEDFRMLNSDVSSVPSSFSSLVADCQIEFCLAVRDPNGNATSGITRTQTSISSFSGYTNMKYTSNGGKDAWNTNDYLNIWVCNLASGLLGFATFPGGNASLDGVVCDYAYFGNIGTATPPYNLGRTATHEVGHWLNLYHIWGDSYCGNDYVSDTPEHEESNYGCPSFPHSSNCSSTGSSGEMFMNYMDYTNDACMYMFTNGQKNRMRATLNTTRSSLLNSQACQPIYPTLSYSSSIANVSCQGFNDGSISISVSGGVPPYNYNWNNGATTANISNLSQGNYFLTITDAVGQTQNSSFYISEPDSILVFYNSNPTTLPGTNDGSISLSVNGGTLPYSFLWSGPQNFNSSSQNLQNLSAGIYNLNLIDANNCIENLSILVSDGQLTNLTVSDIITNVDCFGNSTGEIDLTVIGGIPPYSYLWNNGAVQQDLNSLPSGFYTVQITDSVGQVFLGNYTITEPDKLVVNYNVGNASSVSSNDGFIDLTVSGGISPYSYYWTTSPTQNTQDINNLYPGLYTVYVVDSNNCFLGIDIQVFQDSNCFSPIVENIYANNIIHDRATINWNNMNILGCLVDQYRIQFRPIGSSSWMQKTMGAPIGSCNTGNQKINKILYNLNSNTEYEYRIKAWYCGASASSWSLIDTFITAEDCPLVSNFSAIPLSSTKVRFDWNLNGQYEFLRIKLRQNYVGAPWINAGGMGVLYPLTYKNKNGLISGQTYRGQARTWCDPNGGAYRANQWTNLIFWTMPLSQRLPNSDDRELLYITDILGKKVNKFTSLKKSVLLYIYSNGDVEINYVVDE